LVDGFEKRYITKATRYLHRIGVNCICNSVTRTPYALASSLFNVKRGVLIVMTHFLLYVNVERVKITDTGANILSFRYGMPFIITSLPIQGKMEKMALPNLVLFMKKRCQAS
jgi:hypothetical protein